MLWFPWQMVIEYDNFKAEILEVKCGVPQDLVLRLPFSSILLK